MLIVKDAQGLLLVAGCDQGNVCTYTFNRNIFRSEDIGSILFMEKSRSDLGADRNHCCQISLNRIRDSTFVQQFKTFFCHIVFWTCEYQCFTWFLQCATICCLTVLCSFCSSYSSLWCTISYKKMPFCSFDSVVCWWFFQQRPICVCLLHRIIPERWPGSNSMKTFDSLTVFKAKEFPLSFNVTNEKT